MRSPMGLALACMPALWHSHWFWPRHSRSGTAANAAAYYLGANAVLTFWLAYILTRPLGASLGDLLSQARAYGGFGLGTAYTSIAFLIVIVALVTFVSFDGRRLHHADNAGTTP